MAKLCQDLGASINLMPMSVFKQLGIRDVRPINVTLQLVDRSFAYLEGKIEYVLVRVDKFIFPVDFIVLDYEADKEVPIILGRPFLATGKTFIDVQKWELTMRVDDEHVTFNVLNALCYPNEVEECSVVNIVDNIVSEQFNKKYKAKVLEVLPLKCLEEQSDDEDAQVTCPDTKQPFI